MPNWAGVFFAITLIAAMFGFGGVAGSAASTAQVLFVLFLLVFVVTLVRGWMGHRRSAPW